MRMTVQNKPLVFFSVLLLIALVYALSTVLTPLLISAILAYLGDPLVNKLTRMRVPRLLSVIIIFFIIFLIIGLIFLILIPILQRQIVELIDTLPEIGNRLEAWIRNLAAYFSIEGLNIDTLKTNLANTILKGNTVTAWIGKNVLASGVAIIEWIINLILVPVVTFYLLRDWDTLLNSIQHLFPRSIEPTITKLAKQCDEVLGAFLRGQFLVMICLGIIYGIGLTLIGLKLGIIIGLIAGLVSIVPYLGFIVGLITSLFAVMIQYGTMYSIIAVIIVFLIGQMLEGMILTPMLVGNRVGLHPVAVIFAILAGGSLFGFFGVLLAVPVASVIMVLLRYISHKYHKSEFYKHA